MDTSERRFDERRPASENRASFIWDEGPDCRASSARLIDISKGGAKFEAEVSPPAGRDVCFRLETPRRTGWVLAHIVRAGDSTEGGLSFPSYLPYAMIADVV